MRSAVCGSWVSTRSSPSLTRLKPLITSTGIWCIGFQPVERAIETDRYNKMFRFGRLQRDHGVTVALDSDWPAFK
jgi:predicted amidohydrolase YtcJ